MGTRAMRPIVGHPIPVKLNLKELALINYDDLAQIRNLAARLGRAVLLDGIPPESTLEHPEQPLQYKITDGDVISEHLPNVMNLYTTTIPRLVKDFIGLDILPSRFVRSSVTLNLLEGIGSRYEQHVDSNSVTGLLFAGTLPREAGGALRLYYPDRPPLDIQPEEGVFLLYDARWVPHEVLPLTDDVSRVSLPMNYFLPTDIEERPDFIDSYLFGE